MEMVSRHVAKVGENPCQQDGMVIPKTQDQEPHKSILPSVKEHENLVRSALYPPLVVIEEMVDVHRHTSRHGNPTR